MFLKNWLSWISGLTCICPSVRDSACQRFWGALWPGCRWQHNTLNGTAEQNHGATVSLLFPPPLPFLFSLVSKFLEPFKKWLFMVKTWKSNYACFSSSLLRPVLQSTNQHQRPLEKPSGKHFVILAAHLENPSFRFKHFFESQPPRCSQPSFKSLKIRLPNVNKEVIILRTQGNRAMGLRAARYSVMAIQTSCPAFLFLFF